MTRCLLLGLALVSQSGALLASSSESIMLQHEWNSLGVGQPLVDRTHSRYYVTAIEPPMDGGPNSLLLANDSQALWTRNCSGFRRAPTTDTASLDLRQMVVGEWYWIASTLSPLPVRAMCHQIIRSASGWWVETNAGRILDRQILAIYPDGFDGYHSAGLFLIAHIEGELDRMLECSDE